MPTREGGRAPATSERAVDFDDGVGQVRIGRRPDLELSLPFSALSGVHARLVRSDDNTEWLLEDLGSTNGTFVAGERLKPGVKHPIAAGTQIKLAEIRIVFDGAVKEVKAEHAEMTRAVMPEVRGVALPLRGTPVKGVEMPARSERAGTPVKPMERVGTPVKGMEMPARSERGGTPVKPMDTAGRSERVGTPMTPSRSAEPPPQQQPKAADPPAKLMEPTQTFVRRPASELAAPASAAVPYLTAVDGIREGVKTFRLEQRDHLYMFGRTKRCEFRVKTSDVSREHASFTRRSDGIYVADLGSVNGVFVNNTRVSEFRLYDGDLIQIGHIKLRMFDPTETGRRLTDSAVHTPSRLAPHEHGLAGESAPPPERSVSVHSDFHPAIAGALAAEGGHRQRRPSVRIMFTENWESSSKFRYGVVIIAAAVLAVCAVVIGFSILD